MNRRDFLRANSSICASWALSRAMPVLAGTLSADGWRTFEVVTKVELLQPNGVSHIWLPAPLIRNTPYQNTLSTRFTAEGGTATLSRDKSKAILGSCQRHPFDPDHFKYEITVKEIS